KNVSVLIRCPSVLSPPSPATAMPVGVGGRETDRAPACRAGERSYAITARNLPSVQAGHRRIGTPARVRQGSRRGPEAVSHARHIHRPKNTRAFPQGGPAD